MPITVTYTKPGTNPIKDLAGNEMDSFTDTVTNNVPSTNVTNPNNGGN